MTGLEIPAFVVGVSGIATAFDKACSIWRAIVQARDFGEDMTEWLYRLEFEFFKFQTWWLQLQHASQKHAEHPQSGTGRVLEAHLGHDSLISQLREESVRPIENAVVSIAEILQSIELILQKYDVLQAISHRAEVPPAPAPTVGLSTTLPLIGTTTNHSVMKELVDRNIRKTSLVSKTSWSRRIKFGSSPWKQTDKEQLEEKLLRFSWWTRELYEILPSNMRDSILSSGLAGYILNDVPGDQANQIANLKVSGNDGNREIIETAKLLQMQEKLDFAGEFPEDARLAAELTSRRLPVVGLSNLRPERGRFCTGQYNFSKGGEKRVIVEWYDYSKLQSFEDRQIARQRIMKLSYICGYLSNATGFRVMHNMGFVEDEDRKAFGFLSALPTGSDFSKPPVTLKDALSGTGKVALPNLRQRYSMAQALATSLYSFMILNWFHKSFNSRRIILLTDQSSSKIDMSQTWIGGFDVSRPGSSAEKSIKLDTEPQSLFSHPEIRSADLSGTSPPFSRRYDVYSLGVCLAEIGFWKNIDSLGLKNTAPAQKFKEDLIRKCENELPCWMGARYTEVVLTCLRRDDHDPAFLESHSDFYWAVVSELTDCFSSS